MTHVPQWKEDLLDKWLIVDANADIYPEQYLYTLELYHEENVLEKIESAEKYNEIPPSLIDTLNALVGYAVICGRLQETFYTENEILTHYPFRWPTDFNSFMDIFERVATSLRKKTTGKFLFDFYMDTTCESCTKPHVTTVQLTDAFDSLGIDVENLCYDCYKALIEHIKFYFFKKPEKKNGSIVLAEKLRCVFLMLLIKDATEQYRN